MKPDVKEQLEKELIFNFEFFSSSRRILLLWFWLDFFPPLVPLFYHLLLNFLSAIFPGVL